MHHPRPTPVLLGRNRTPLGYEYWIPPVSTGIVSTSCERQRTRTGGFDHKAVRSSKALLLFAITKCIPVPSWTCLENKVVIPAAVQQQGTHIQQSPSVEQIAVALRAVRRKALALQRSTTAANEKQRGKLSAAQGGIPPAQAQRHRVLCPACSDIGAMLPSKPSIDSAGP